jgi:hypothetical protein
VIGGLSVLNDEGKPACKQYETAKKITESGGNFYKLLCSKCPHRATCNVKNDSQQGEGLLTITNHAVAHTLLDDEKVTRPLLIWDESPPFTHTGQIESSSVTALRRVLSMGKSVMDANAFRRTNGVVVAKDVSIALRPIVSFLEYTLDNAPVDQVHFTSDYVRQWEKTLHSNVVVTDMLNTLTEHGVHTGAQIWESIRAALKFARGRIFAGVDFNTATKQMQESILYMEKLLQSITALTGERSTLRVKLTPSGMPCIEFGSLTDQSIVLSRYGGVVLDATAPISSIQAIAPRTEVIDIVVRDHESNKINREMHFNALLSATQSSKKPAETKAAYLEVIAECKYRISKWADVHNIKAPRVVVITYKKMTDFIREMWPEVHDVLHYGNTRGYDHLFQNGACVFITIGDPYHNIGSLQLTWPVLRGSIVQNTNDPEWRVFLRDTARSELAQAHGRARSVQKAKTEHGYSLHIHYGTTTPMGWYRQTTQTNIDKHPLLTGEVVDVQNNPFSLQDIRIR